MRTLFVVSYLILAAFIIVQPVEVEAKASEQLALTSVLGKKKWIHGAMDCKFNKDPAIEVFRYDHSSYVLRQNKCLSFEAPFMYVLIGKNKVLVLDTGASDSASDFPLYKMVMSLVLEHSLREGVTEKELLVIHSHSHRDHYAGDAQFKGKPNVTLVEPNGVAVQQYYNFRQWPDGQATIDLGARKLIIIPTPGHQEDAITIYDSQTKWLLTGDTLYPGYIYVKNWNEYKQSIARLVSFAEVHDISVILGSHIEMTKQAGEYYSIGTVYQPNEVGLTLLPEDLGNLHAELNSLDKPTTIIFDGFIVAPMSAFQKTISRVVKWFVQ